MRFKIANLVWTVVVAAIGCEVRAQGWLRTSGTWQPAFNPNVYVSSVTSDPIGGGTFCLASDGSICRWDGSSVNTVTAAGQLSGIGVPRTITYLTTSGTLGLWFVNSTNTDLWSLPITGGTPTPLASEGGVGGHRIISTQDAGTSYFLPPVTGGNFSGWMTMAGAFSWQGAISGNRLTTSIVPNLYSSWGSGIGAVILSAFADPSDNQIRLVTNGPNGGVRFYRVSGNNWLQEFPIAPFSLSPFGPTQFGTASGICSWFTPGPPSLGSLAHFYTLDANLNLRPRSLLYANGNLNELFLTSYPPATTSTNVFDAARGVFVAFVADGSIWELNLGPSAQFSTFGAGCLGSRSTPTLTPQQGSLPRIGTNFTLQALNLPLAGPVFLAIGASDTLYGPTPLPLNLGPLGAPQCNLLVGIDNLFSTSNVLGAAAWTFPIPNIPGGIFFSQAVVFDPPANTFGVTLSNGGRGVVGS
jgi:hypothetical protein